MSPASALASASAERKVRTVPPSAIFDPPTPELETPARGADATTSVPPPRRRRRRLHYSSSSSSAASESDSDAEPPWWTFTARGMQRLRSHGERERGSDGRRRSEDTSAAEYERAPRFRRRREDRDDSGHPSLSSRPSRGSQSRQSTTDVDRQSGTSTPNETAGQRARRHRPFGTNSAVLRRMSGLGLASALGNVPGSPSFPPPTLTVSTGSSAGELGVAPAMQRSSSAPSSPVMASPRSPMTTTPARHGVFLDVPAPSSEPAARRRPRRGTSDLARATGSLTDSETVLGPAPKPRARRLFSLAHLREHNEDSATISGTTPVGTPTRIADADGGEGDDEGANAYDASPAARRPRARRLQTHQLRLRLPPEMKQHFKDGWPHAGSWQDALYNYEDWARDVREREHEGAKGRRSSTRSQDGADAPAQVSASDGELARGRATPRRTPAGTPRAERPTPQKTPSSSRKRTKSRRNRRTFAALVPPTPGGLGFIPSNHDVGPNGGPAADGPANGNANGYFGGTNDRLPAAPVRAHVRDPTNPFDRIDEELERAETATTEKDSLGARRRGHRPIWCFPHPWRRRDDPARRKYIEELDWRARFRRMIFLDARLTVYLRVLNLAVIVTLLGLAVAIRLELDALYLPGLIGPSTTLIIAYASLTVLHVLTAIYREYFGRPIGLWGLRSKMLWVCLDLLFVALWASATSLAANDYLQTPLDCTAAAPWWTSGLDYDAFAAKWGLGTAGTGTDAEDGFGYFAVPDQVKASPTAHHACERQLACIVLSVFALALYGGNMVLSLFRIFETVRRTANQGRAVSV
ncbi:hypothetical protein Q5752_001222 [Cryptotrichosporon argae]